MRWVVELPTASDAAAAAVTVEADSWAGALTNARNGVPVKKFRCEFEDDGVVRVTNLETRERYTVRPFKGSLSDTARAVPSSDQPPTFAEAPASLGSESALFGSGGPPSTRAPAPESPAGAPSAAGKTPAPSAPARGGRERSGTLMAWPDLMADSEPSQVSGTRTMPAKPDRTRSALTRTGQFRAASRSSRPPPRTADSPKPDLPMPSAARAAHESLRSSPPTIPPPTGGTKRAISSAIPAATRTDAGTSPSPITHATGPSALRAPSAATVTAPLTPATPAETAPPAEARHDEAPVEPPGVAAQKAETSAAETAHAAPAEAAPSHETNGAARTLNGSSMAVESSPLAEALPEPVVLFERNHEPDSHNPLTYRERVLVVPRGTTPEQAEQIARQMLTGLRRSLATRAKGRYITIAVFDHIFTSRPAYPPLVVVRWKDWRGEPEVIFPDKGPNGNGGGAPPSGSPMPSPSPPPAPPSGAPPANAGPSETNAAPAASVAPSTSEPPQEALTTAPSPVSEVASAKSAAPATQLELAPAEPPAPPVAEAHPESRVEAPRETPPPAQAPAATEPPPAETPPTAVSAGSSSEREPLVESPIVLIPKAAPLPLVEKAAALPLVQKRTQTLLMVASPSPPPPAMEPPAPAAPESPPPAAPAPVAQAPAAQASANARRSTEPKQKPSKSARKKQKRATAEQRLSTPSPQRSATAPSAAPAATVAPAVTTAPETTATTTAELAPVPAPAETPAPVPSAEAPATPEPAPVPVAPEASESETRAVAEAPAATTITEPASAEKAFEAATAPATATPVAEPAATTIAASPATPAEPPAPAVTAPVPSEKPAPTATESRASSPLSKPLPLSATSSSAGEAARRASSSALPVATASASTTPTGKAPPPRCAKGAARRRGKDLLSDLFDALMELSFQTSGEDACAFVAKLLWENLTADACVVSLYDINHDEFVAAGVEGAGVAGAREKATRGSRGTAVRRHLAVSHAKVDASESIVPDWCGGPAAFVASYHRERLFGLIQVQRTPGGAVFEPDEEDGISYVAAQLGEFLAQNSKRQAVAEYSDDGGGGAPSKPARPTARR